MSSSGASSGDAEEAAPFAGPDAHRVLALLLPLLPPDAAQCVAATCRAWRAAAASAPERWRALDFRGCGVTVNDAAFATLCARAGAQLRELRLDAACCERVTTEGAIAALLNGGCAGLRRFVAFKPAAGLQLGTLRAPVACALAEACPALEHAACHVVCDDAGDAVNAGSALPGPLTFVFGRVELPPRAFDDLQLAPSVTALNLSNAWWEAEGARTLATALHGNDSVTSLFLAYNQIEDDGAQAVAAMLQANKRLADLDLNVNYISHVGGRSLADALHVNPSLTRLSLGNNRLYDVGAAALAAALHANASLRELEVAANGVGDAGAAAFAEALRVNSTLRVLKLGGNGITLVGAALLSEALAVNATLRDLDLSANRIYDAGAVSLGHALWRNRSLQTLTLRDCSIRDAGVAALAEGLATNGALETLHMGTNDTTVEGATALARALCTNSTLKHLDLSSSRGIGDAGALEFADALRVNSTLRSLDLSCCRVDDLGATVLGQALQANRSLADLSLMQNQITEVGGAACIAAWAQDDAMLMRLDLRYNKHAGAGNEALLVQGKTQAGHDWWETMPELLRQRLF